MDNINNNNSLSYKNNLNSFQLESQISEPQVQPYQEDNFIDSIFDTPNKNVNSLQINNLSNVNYNKFDDDLNDEEEKFSDFGDEKQDFQEKIISIPPLTIAKSQAPQKEKQGEIIAQQKVTKQIKKKINNNSKYKYRNCCKYLVQKSITQFISPTYRAYIISKCCNNDLKLYEEVIEYFDIEKCKITGFTSLKYYLDFEVNENIREKDFKIVFYRFLKFFLKDRMSRYIMHGDIKPENQLMYIQYKNKVLLKYIDDIKKWKYDRL